MCLSGLECVENDTITTWTNISETHRDETPHTLYRIGVSCIGTVVMIANILVMISIKKILKKSPPDKATYIFMGNLALSDALNALFIIVGALIPERARSINMCYVNLGAILSVTMMSLYSVVLMSLDKYIYIVHCLRYRDIATSRRAKITAVMLWVAALVLGYIPLYLCRTNHTETCMFVLIVRKDCFVSLVVVGIFIPLGVILVSYAIVLKHAIQFLKRKKERVAQNLAGAKYMKNRKSTESIESNKILGVAPETWRAFGACVIIVIAFEITWGPYFIYSWLYYTCGSDEERCETIQTSLATFLAFLGFCNSLLNPLIYTWWHKGFWKITIVFTPCISACRAYIHKKKNTIRSCVYEVNKEENPNPQINTISQSTFTRKLSSELQTPQSQPRA